MLHMNMCISGLESNRQSTNCTRCGIEVVINLGDTRLLWFKGFFTHLCGKSILNSRFDPSEPQKTSPIDILLRFKGIPRDSHYAI